MRFGIAGLGLGAPFVEISGPEFNRVKLAKQKILRSVSIEDKFDLLLANYADFERELLDLALHQMIYSDLSFSSGQIDTQNLNRRILNLLSAGRLYTDQLRHNAEPLVDEDNSLIDRIKRVSSEQYEGKLGYRVMEALRNYTQHQSLPVHRLRYPSAWIPPGEWKNMIHRAVPSIVPQELRQDSRIKLSIVDELEAIGTCVPLTPLIREYVDGIAVIHREFREFAEAGVRDSEEAFRWTWDRYRTECSTDSSAVKIAALNDQNRYEDEGEIFEDIITYRNDLARKNQVLGRLSKRFVSGECELHET